MWKIATFLFASLLMSSSEARPGYLHTSVVPATAYDTIEYAPTVVGHTVHHLPTAISHQSQTIVHEKRPYLRPIVQHTPVVHHHAPIVHSAPVLAYSSYPSYPSYPAEVYGAGWSGGSPLVYGSAWPLK